MPLEIDMLAVGDANAILIRTTKGQDEQVIVVDGGNSDDGDAIIDHLYRWTTRKTCVDLLVNTHPDGDHVNGLHTVVNNLDIYQAWIHDPSAHHANVKALIRDLWSTNSSIIREAAKSLDSATQLINTLDARGIPRTEPFAGKSFSLLDGGVLTVLGPTQAYYADLLENMKQQAEKALQHEIVMEQLREIRAAKSDATARQQLDEDNDLAPSNNSSVIFTITYGSLSYLFTADAGPTALEKAKELYPTYMQDVYWLQVPHHGSRRSLTCNLIDFIHPNAAFISANCTSKHHPDRVVVEVLKEVGCRVYCTSKTDSGLYHSHPSIHRTGYVTAQELELSDLAK